MKKFYFLGVAVVMMTTIVSCRPYDRPEYVDIGTNDTAFAIKLEQKQTENAVVGEDMWKKNLVNAKRIEIPHRWNKTGRANWKGKWIPTIKVVKVSRSPVSVLWDENSANKQIKAESKESIGFTVPITLTATIADDDAAIKFLNKWGSDKTLEDAVNTTLNAFIQDSMNKKLSALGLEEDKKQKSAIITAVGEELKAYALENGITITQFGGTSGFVYDKKEIQEAIDKQAIAQAEGKRLQEEQENQKIINATNAITAKNQNDIDLKNAETARKIAEEKAATATTLARLQEIENSKTIADAQAEAIKAGATRQWPSTLIVTPEFANVLGLDSIKSGSGN